jgi:hypothetical protein
MSKLNILLPDWVAKRREAERVSEILTPAPPEPDEKTKYSNRSIQRKAHRAKELRNRRLANKRARKSRRRNRVGKN